MILIILILMIAPFKFLHLLGLDLVFVFYLILKYFRMDIYAIYESCDLGYVLQEVYENLMLSYSSGCTNVRIYVRSELAISYLKRWMPGWIRKAPPGGVWKDSRGNIKMILIFFIVTV